MSPTKKSANKQAVQHHENTKSLTLAIEVSTSATKKSANVIGCTKPTSTKSLGVRNLSFPSDLGSKWLAVLRYISLPQHKKRLNHESKGH